MAGAQHLFAAATPHTEADRGRIAEFVLGFVIVSAGTNDALQGLLYLSILRGSLAQRSKPPPLDLT
jgi:hypothetical protein